MTAAVPQTPPPKPEPEKRRYVVLSRKCVWGTKGETIELALGDGEEALLRAGTLERAPEVRPVEQKRPIPAADRKDRRHG